MTLLTSWDDFEMAAERLYLQDPIKVKLFVPETTQSLFKIKLGSILIHPYSEGLLTIIKITIS